VIQLLVTFMEQRQAPAGEALRPPIEGIEISNERLSVAEYLSLYRAIGEAVQWDDRLRMAESDLQELLQAKTTSIFVLSRNGEKIGLFEAVRHSEQEFEITYFGLVPHAQGQRLGPYLLDAGLRSLWKLHPSRVWLHTDTNDHPAAVGTYERAGFTVTDRKWMHFPD
jgi:ribosomal protein S18 acetylase RimI-like enzyme